MKYQSLSLCHLWANCLVVLAIRYYNIAIVVIVIEYLMNRKKKLNQIFNKRLKKAKAKLNPNTKEKYVSKADREVLDTTEVEVDNASEVS